jgi:hypothetical protein
MRSTYAHRAPWASFTGVLGAGMTVVYRCLAGQFLNSAIANCSQCAPGSYTSDLGATSCLPCPAGRFGTMTGAYSFALGCLPCPAGSFSGQVGSLSGVGDTVTLRRPCTSSAPPPRTSLSLVPPSLLAILV